jgi:hypothetical protein
VSYIFRFLKIAKLIDKEGNDAIAARTAGVHIFSRNVGVT